MKMEDQEAFFEKLEPIINEAVDLGMARQRHIDAAADENACAETVGEYVKELMEFMGASAEKPTIQ